jgi:hypothetical protein
MSASRQRQIYCPFPLFPCLVERPPLDPQPFAPFLFRTWSVKAEAVDLLSSQAPGAVFQSTHHQARCRPCVHTARCRIHPLLLRKSLPEWVMGLQLRHPVNRDSPCCVCRHLSQPHSRGHLRPVPNPRRSLQDPYKKVLVWLRYHFSLGW